MGAAGGIAGYVGSVADVSNLKQAEEALRRSEEELRQAQKMETVGQLTDGVAHDFNNLLTIILGNLAMIAEAAEDRDDIAVLSRSATTAAIRGSDLTQRLLAFARAAASAKNHES